MRHPEFPVISFLCVPLVLSALPSHIRNRSVPIISLAIWLTAMSIIHGVNSIAWANNVNIKLKVWCDIATKIEIGYTFAVPASALCLMHHLESVASARQVGATHAQKRRRQIFELVMCFGCPLIFMVLHYVVQGHRFDIIEDIGCSPAVYWSAAGILVVWLTPLLLSLVSFVYAALTLHHFLRHRISFVTHLRNSQSALSPNRYFRLMALAIVEMTLDFGINVYLLKENFSTAPLQPWISWQNVHSNFSRVQQLPKFLLPNSFMNIQILAWWFVPLACFLFFVFFAFGEEAMSDYRACFVWFRRTILRQRVENSKKRGEILPSYNSHPKRDIHVNINKRAFAEDEVKAPWDSCSTSLPDLTTPSTPSDLEESQDTKSHQLHNESIIAVHEAQSISMSLPGTDCPPSHEKFRGSVSEQDVTVLINEPETNNLTSVSESTDSYPQDGVRVTVERTVSISH